MAAWLCSSDVDAILMVPSSSMSILQPVVLDDVADHLAPGADHLADLSFGTLMMVMRGAVAATSPRAPDRPWHLAQDVQPASRAWASAVFMISKVMGRVILMSHLQAGDARLRPRDLEVHVAQVVLVTQDVGQHGEPALLLDQPPWRYRPPGASAARPRPSAIREVPQTVAMEDEPLLSVISLTTRMV